MRVVCLCPVAGLHTPKSGGLPLERGGELSRCSTVALNDPQQLLGALRSACHDRDDNLRDRAASSGNSGTLLNV